MRKLTLIICKLIKYLKQHGLRISRYQTLSPKCLKEQRNVRFTPEKRSCSIASTLTAAQKETCTVRNATIAVGTNGQILTSNGTTWGAGARLTSGTVQTASNSANLTFTGIPSWAKRITVMVNNVATGGSSGIIVQLGTGGTPTTTGYVNQVGIISTTNNITRGTIYTTGFGLIHAGSTSDKFCGSLIPYLKDLTEKEKSILKSIDIHNLEESEEILNPFLTKKIDKIGFKNLGFNITKLSDNYCEFRYTGGEISKDVLIEKVKYFAFVVYCMTNPEYKRKEYIKKLYKFIDTL